MYSKLSGGLAAAGAASTPFWGIGTGWTVVLAVTVLVAGAALFRLIPKRRSGRRG